MKVLIADTVIELKNLSAYGIEQLLQSRYDKWLGKDMVKVKVLGLEHKRIDLSFERKYGSWYEDPARFPSEIDTYINQWDEQIFLGEGYFEGGKADFENHQSPYIISDHIDDFTSQYKKKAKERHCSRVKKLEFEAFIDHFNISIILV